MNKFFKNHNLSLSASTRVKSPNLGDLFNVDGSREQTLARAVKAVRLALVSKPPTDSLNTNAQKEEHLHLPARWAVKMSEIKRPYNKWMDEDVLMYECVALGSWERQ